MGFPSLVALRSLIRLPCTHLISRSQGPSYQSGTFAIYDLWQKDSAGAWGQNVGTYTGSMPSVQIGAHQVRVWKAVPVSTSSKRGFDEL